MQVDVSALVAQQEVVRLLKDEARIVIVMLYPTDVRNFLVTCLDEGMLDGRYAFIGSDQLETDVLSFVYRPEVGQ